MTGNVPKEGDDWTGSAFVPHVETPEELTAKANTAQALAVKTAFSAELAKPENVAAITETAVEKAARIGAMSSVISLRAEVLRLACIVDLLMKERKS